jgi:hypothetical protein
VGFLINFLEASRLSSDKDPLKSRIFNYICKLFLLISKINIKFPNDTSAWNILEVAGSGFNLGIQIFLPRKAGERVFRRNFWSLDRLLGLI